MSGNNSANGKNKDGYFAYYDGDCANPDAVRGRAAWLYGFHHGAVNHIQAMTVNVSRAGESPFRESQNFKTRCPLAAMRLAQSWIEDSCRRRSQFALPVALSIS
jgi:hypothetical protein